MKMNDTIAAVAWLRVETALLLPSGRFSDILKHTFILAEQRIASNRKIIINTYLYFEVSVVIREFDS